MFKIKQMSNKLIIRKARIYGKNLTKEDCQRIRELADSFYDGDIERAIIEYKK